MAGLAWRFWMAVAALLALSGCTHSPPNYHGAFCQAETGDVPTETSTHLKREAPLALQYLGISGLAFTFDGVTLVTPPLFSRPRWFDAPQDPEHAAAVDNAIPRLAFEPSAVQGIIVGHSHYDHLFDVPRLLNRHFTNAHAYGSKSTRTLICLQNPNLCDEPNARVHALAAMTTSTACPDDKQLNVGPFCITPLRSEHAHHVAIGPLKKRFWSGNARGDRQPRTLNGWRGGRTYAYLIDVMAGGDVAYRIYYQDTAANLLDPLPDGRAVDLAVVALASHQNVAGYPAALVAALKADVYVISHWENFLFGRRQGFITAPDDFVEALETADAEATWVLPRPFQQFALPLVETPHPCR